MPEPPKPAWGDLVNGVRCGVAIDSPDPTIGDEVTALVKFENTTDRHMALYYDAEQADKGLVISNDQGQVLAIEPVRSEYDRFQRRRRGRPVKRIGPGGFFENEIEGRIVAGSESAEPVWGKFNAVFNFKVEADMLDEVDEEIRSRVWTGELISDVFELQLGSMQQESCISCHDGSDYHHKEVRDCTTCHTGKMGTDDFGINKEGCSQCHKRPGKFGRRQIAGQGGEFDMYSKHISGAITDKDCLACHDHSRHRSGEVILADPHSGSPWSETQVGFCLRCHGDKAPGGTSFPAEAAGSGYHKSEFARSAHGRVLGDKGCSSCHNSHGSTYPSLLKADYIATAWDDIAGDGVFDACWQCHQESKVVKESNSFGKLHGMHVAGARLHCLVCHDAHGGSDSDEPGSIRFRAGIHSGFEIEFINGRDASSSFEINPGGSEGTCYVACHQGKGSRKYLRGPKSK
ncbi:MAG: cytochrome c3 family protein [Planctomycetota bacterium]